MLSASLPHTSHWKATSKTARAITGDISLSDTSLRMHGKTYPTRENVPLNAGELRDAAVLFAIPSGAEAQGEFRRIYIATRTRLVQNNTLCPRDAQWMLTLTTKAKTLEIAFFSGEAKPDITPSALDNSTHLCGTFYYEEDTAGISSK